MADPFTSPTTYVHPSKTHYCSACRRKFKSEQATLDHIAVKHKKPATAVPVPKRIVNDDDHMSEADRLIEASWDKYGH